MTRKTLRRPKPSEIPDQPGVYLFKDRSGRVIYVGKALSLRNRVSSYFQDLGALMARTAAMVESAADVELIVFGIELFWLIV